MTVFHYLHGDEYEDSMGRPGEVECNRCGKANLHWEEEEDGRWTLVGATGLVHKCDMQRAALDDFDVIG
jgi:hypothetical protein